MNLNLFSAIAVILVTTTPIQAEVWSPWVDLANFKPDAAPLKQARANRGHSTKDYKIQRIHEGSGDAVNIDEYVVRIDALPTGMNKAQFFWHVRKNLNNFFDHTVATFDGFSSGDADDWRSQSNALLGTIMVFDIKTFAGGHDQAAVVVSRFSDFSWVFSPVTDDGLILGFGDHPVAGNREFGLREVGAHMEFYTRAFDRVYPLDVSLLQGTAFKGADDLWKSFQTNLETYVNSNGGSATKKTPTVPGGNVPTGKPQYADVCADPAVKLSCN
ncbi:hypothetical protein [Roseibium aggregatum]|uniref:hypothetical protein n=1 Tax=Roseibium aggregatum TaxID=187304 RepID=UPI001E5C6B86|nr:hypothetical protein [Roseibium aggregatum]UES49918.1 hypothetical protein GFK88_10005 [Roseibium aggregatum]